MSRPMALGLVLLVLFLTSQSEWKTPRNPIDSASSAASRQLRVEKHRDGVKEKIIMDLMAENKRLEAERERFRHLLEEMQRRLVACCHANPRLDTQPLDETLMPTGVSGRNQMLSQSHALSQSESTASRRYQHSYLRRVQQQQQHQLQQHQQQLQQQQQSFLIHGQGQLGRVDEFGRLTADHELQQRLLSREPVMQDDDALVQRSAMDMTHLVRIRGHGNTADDTGGQRESAEAAGAELGDQEQNLAPQIAERDMAGPLSPLSENRRSSEKDQVMEQAEQQQQKQDEFQRSDSQPLLKTLFGSLYRRRSKGSHSPFENNETPI